MKNIEEELQELYNDFLKELQLDENGYLGKRKFQNNIRIGKDYVNWNPKILIVGLDAGSDNCKPFKKIIKLKEIEISDNCEIDGTVNPHMAGVYGTVLFFQKDEELKKSLKESRTFQSAIKDTTKRSKELLSSFALVNFYSFVTKERKNKTGGKDRIFIDKKLEKAHLIKIIDTINPDIIVVQSKQLKGDFEEIKKKIKNESAQIYIGYHPSVVGRYREPKLYFKDLLENLL
ncbi:hypothetical protein EZS27_022784 [termite gut metagenome]|uniref:Uracil-DNA glycosylase-like domain-containing protein n=1 Tax=termite gut metagenome TaxID=433724 RepID=A0A5J4R3M0_9ZZZZ